MEEIKIQKMDRNGRWLYRKLWAEVTSGSYKNYILEIFVFIFYDHFCKITNLSWIDEKAEANRKRKQME